MRPGLRGKILLFTVPPLVTLTVASLVMVDRNVSTQVNRQIQDDLRRSSAVFENMLHARSSALAVAGGVIVRDPKFFSVLSLPVAPNDPQYQATVAGVAEDFNRITQADVFDVLDSHGRVIASTGRISPPIAAQDPLVRQALAGGATAALLSEPGAHYQAVVTPVVADGRVVGALLLGAAVDGALASQLRELTRSEVTFLSDGRVTGTTLSRNEDLDAAVNAARRRRTVPNNSGVFELHAPGQTWVALARPIPGAADGSRQGYVMQRSLDVETIALRQVRDGLVLMGLVAAILALLAGLVIAQRITSPIGRMVRAAEAMEHGNYDYPLEVASRDEIGYLATRFEDMRSQQRAVVASLQESARVRREFITVASHELRTPISIIHGFHELFGDGALGPVTEAQHKALEAIGRSIKTLTRIAADATRMAQIEEDGLKLTLDRSDLADVAAVAVRDARGAATGRSVDVVLEASPGVAWVRADAARLADAVSQLIRNGIRYTRDGGRVHVRVRCDGDRARLEVCDTGIGIAAPRLQQLLDRQMPVRDSTHHHSSSTLEFNSAGLGLGLAIASGIVRAHGGTLEAESREGHGSTFTIVLPEDMSAGIGLAA